MPLSWILALRKEHFFPFGVEIGFRPSKVPDTPFDQLLHFGVCIFPTKELRLFAVEVWPRSGSVSAIRSHMSVDKKGERQ